MAASPIYGIPKIGPDGVMLNVAVTSRDGALAVAAGAKSLLYTAGASGGIFHFARATPMGTCAAGILRFWHNNGLDDTIAANNALLPELQFLATTASEVTAVFPLMKWFSINMAAGHRIYVARSTFTAGNAAIAVQGEGVDF
jgi:hypothetical protein